jgi:uncharacterized membrane protein ArfC
MNTVNWWLMVLAFALGLLLTFVTTVRRVQREVPISRAAGGAGASGDPVTVRSASGRASAEAQTTKMPAAQHELASTSEGKPYVVGEAADTVTAKAPTAQEEQYGAGSVQAAADATTANIASPESVDEPYGRGSVRVAAGSSAPAGYTVKGNEDSMLYHTPDSPSYKQTIAEVWFKDEDSAVHAGFTPWHKGRARRSRQ